MKKTTKILLVLAAVVAMTIGAVSTVMAADYPTIGAWSYDETSKKYSATDVDGNAITRGWATENGLWYYFESGKMVTNSFITSEGQTYYLNANGQMHTGWAEFKGDAKVTLNKIEYSNVLAAFSSDVNIIDNAWAEGVYKTLWIYCDETGALQTEKWINAYGLWYYMDGAFCLIYEWNVELPVDNGKTETAIYGFSKDGNMHVGWIPYTTTTAAGAATGKGPYEQAGTAATTTIAGWTYYGTDGKQAVKEWNKIGDQWCYFRDDNTYGKVLITDSIVNDGKYEFYFDADGYMVSGAKTFAKDAKLTYVDANGVVDTTKSVEKLGAAVSFYFDAVTGMKSGVVNGVYYKAANDTTYEVTTVATGSAISFTTTGPAITTGSSVTGDFFLRTKDKDGNEVAMYYEVGKLVKDEAITLGNVTFIIDANGYVVNATKDVTVDGVTYKVGTTKLTVGDMEFVGVEKK